MRTRPILLSALLASALVATLAAQQPAAAPTDKPADAAPAPAATPAAAPVTPADAPKAADVTPAPAPVPAPAVAPAPAPAAPVTPAAAPADAAKPADGTAPAPTTDVTVKDGESHPGIATKGKDSTGKDTLSVDFPDEDVRTILRNVADLFELNIIIPETLQGKTTIKLRDVTWRQIFQNVLAPVGYTYVEDGNIIKIISNDSLQQEPTSTEVFILNYAKAGDVLPTLSALVDSAAGGKIVVDSRSNSLVLTERPSRMNRIRPILEQLDRATDQVMIETKFIEVSTGDARDLGVNWSVAKNFRVSLSNTTDMLNKLVGGPGGANHAVLNSDEFGLVFSALTALSGTRVISNPTIVTLNNTEATINVGEEDPIPSYSYNDQRGTFEVSGFAYKSIGINLKVTPQVNARGFVKLTVSPEVSQKNGSVNFGGAGGASIPIIATRRATTQVSLKDGYTMGIGGLITSQNTTTDTKLPVLGNIPVLGYLFREKSTNVVSTNLLIFVTAKSVAADGGPVEQIFDSRQVREMDLNRSDLPGYRDGSDPFLPAGGKKK